MKKDNQNKVASFWKSRPKIPVLLICLFETLGLLLIPSAIFSEEASAIGVWYQIYIGLTSLMTIAIIYLLWRMSIKGIVVYLAAYSIHNLIALIAGNWIIGVLIIPVVGIILILLSLKHFKNNHCDNRVARGIDSPRTTGHTGPYHGGSNV